MKVMSFNIRCDVETTSPGEADYWPERSRLVTDMLRKQRPDILGVQELTDNQIGTVLYGLGNDYAWTGGYRGVNEKAGERNAIFYNTNVVELSGAQTLTLSDTPKEVGSITWKNKNPRILTAASFLIKKTREPLTVVNTHFDHISEYSRIKSAQMVQKIISGLHHTILMGDFNCVAEKSTTYDIFLDSLIDTKTNASTVSNDYGTFGNYKEPVPLGDRVDWIMCTDDFDVEEYTTIDAMGDEGYPSDHLPVVAVLNLKM